MTAYYSENDPFAAAWLRELIKAGEIAPGFVDERDIRDVTPDELMLLGYDQHHFFAGIGTWSYALRQAGWPDDRSVWTGSCPCQPFSAAGKGAGFDDERHLWPAWHWLIAQCRPERVFGEQVAAKNADSWVDLVHADMEALDYAFGCIPFPAAGIGAPHIRDRNYWVADALRGGAGDDTGESLGAQAAADRSVGHLPRERLRLRLEGASDRLANGSQQQHGTWDTGPGERPKHPISGCTCRVALADGRNSGAERQQRGGEQRQQQENSGTAIGLGHHHHQRLPLGSRPAERRGALRDEGASATAPSALNGFWRNAQWLWCSDERWRPTESGISPLVNGATNRVGKLRGFGNSLVAPQAQIFIESVMDVLDDPGSVV